ncbi:MAG: M20 metallopeptidase family protein [Caulobacteraceae bacterium]
MLKQEAQSIEQYIIAWRRDLHRIPEIGLHLPKTREYICGVLDKLGINYKIHSGTSGIEVLICGRTSGKTIALRSDMDALPIRELTGLPFASENGNMHACGHDAHIAMLLGAVKLLAAHPEQIIGNVKCIFQPGEEGFQGARYMLEEGALENPYVDAVLGLHVTNTISELKPGAIGLKKGALMAGSDAFCIKIIGKGGHISDTKHVVNPIPAAARIVLAIQEIGDRCGKMEDKAIIATGQICGGEKGNAIPDTVELKGSLRTLNEETRQQLLHEMKQTVKKTAAQERCICEISFADSNGVIYNDGTVTESVMKTASQLFPQEKYTEIVSDIMASEDIFYFFNARKGTYIHLGCGFEDSREIFPLHSSRFTLNEQIMWRGSALLAQSAIDWLGKEHL